jgi:hypothetical protein
MSLYMMGMYMSEDAKSEPPLLAWFKQAWAKSGKKKLDMGKCCIRFKNIDDIPLDLIGEAFKRQTLKKYVEHYEASLAASKARPKGKPAAKGATKTAKKRVSSAKAGKKKAPARR